MHRPKPKLKHNLINLINEVLNGFMVDEILEPQKTEFKKLNGNSLLHNYTYDTYRFITKNNNSYDVEFYKQVISLKDIKYIEGFDNKETIGIIIGFTPSEIAEKEISDDIAGGINDPYIQRTNKNEQYEVIGKVIYLVQEYVKNNPNYYIYLILKNTYDKNLMIYNSIYNNIFKNDFNVYESNDTFYYIKNNINLKQ